MSGYKEYYIRYKNRYIREKNKKKESKKGKKGGGSIGFYKKNNKLYLTKRTNYGRIFSYREEYLRDDLDFTYNLKKKDKNKIIKIDSIFLFDWFTSRYGFDYEIDKIGIHWDKVAEDYKGFYIEKNSDILLMRGSNIPFKRKRKTFTSWLKNEDLDLDRVLIFN